VFIVAGQQQPAIEHHDRVLSDAIVRNQHSARIKLLNTQSFAIITLLMSPTDRAKATDLIHVQLGTLATCLNKPKVSGDSKRRNAKQDFDGRLGHDHFPWMGPGSRSTNRQFLLLLSSSI
jgi:hypothetical protein